MTDKNDEFDGLTDEERAILKEDDEAPESDASETPDEDAAEAPGEAVDEDGEGEDAPDETADEDDEPSAAGAEEEEPAAPAPAADEDAVLPPAPAEFTAADETRQAEIAKARDDLYGDYDEGNLTRDELKEKMRELDQEDRTLATKQARWGDYEEAANKAWDTASTKWLEAHPEVLKLEPDALGNFDRLMRAYTASGLGDGLSVKAQHDKVLAEFRERYPDALPKEEPPKKADKRHPADKRRAATPPERVPSLAGMPAAEGTDVNDGEFANLERLMERDYEAYERAVAKLTPEQEKRYNARG